MGERDDDLSQDSVGEFPWRASATDSDEDLHDREIRARLRALIVGDRPQPLYVGRFRLLRKLGQGGMGTVYAAHDDELDREVALKLLLPGRRYDEQATQRLRREALALAKLSHPNLVPVFEVGEFEGQVFLVMELVAGVTMDVWMRARPRPWQQVLGLWLDVARALAAVHDAQLVHRDVKPNNVLVGPDDRARLVDFGLARARVVDDDTRPVVDADTGLGSNSDVDTGIDTGPPGRRSAGLQQLITQPCAIVGTPAYMAPEQRAGAVAGPQADQFSLCVSIYECLYGRRPEPVTSKHALVEVPDPQAVPVAVRRALTRGLAREPGHRFPDVHALVRALEHALHRRNRRLWLTGTAMLIAAIGSAVLTRQLAPVTDVPPDPCAVTDDDLDGVWDSAHRDALHTAIVATDVPYAARMSQRLERSVQDYAGAWLRARRETCEATHVEHVQSGPLLDRRMACLDGQRQSLAAMLAAVSAVTPDQLPRVPMMITDLGDPQECLADVSSSTELTPPPAKLRAQVEDLRDTIARLRYDGVLVGPNHVWADAEQVVVMVDELGYRPLQAEASLMLGSLYQYADDPRARPHLERAANFAESVDHVRVKEQALRQLARLAIDVELDLRAAEALLDRDFAVIERLGGTPQRTASALGLRAASAELADDHVAAEAALRKAVAILQEQGERQTPALATSLRDLGNLLVGRGRLDEAEELFVRAGRLDAEWGGVDLQAGLGHTLRGHGELVRGVAATHAGRFDEADTWLERARGESAAGYGEQSVPVGRVEVALADLALRQGRLDEVLTHAQAADACFRRWLGEDHQLRASPIAAIGTVAFHLGQGDRAVAAFEDELRLSLLVLPPHGARVATARSNLGEALVLAGRDDDAEPVLEQALADFEHVSPDDVSFPAHALAEIAWHRNDLDTAERHARRALALREEHLDDPIELARTRWLLAQIQLARAQPADARKLAEAARDDFVGLGPSFADRVEQIDHWLRDLP